MSVLRAARAALEDAGLRGSFLVRDLDTGEEIGIDPDEEYPIASLVKVPLAVATLERAARGEIDPALPVTIRPEQVTGPGPTGLSKFRHPATVAVDDLLHLSMAISDNVAADTLFALTPPARVTAELRRLGHDGITVRHLMRDLAATPASRFSAEDAHLAQRLAIDGATSGGGHPVSQLDVSRANSGSARALADLVHAVWRPSNVDADVAGRVRELMGENLLRQRLAPDFATDSARWSSKTGTLLNLRHEVGVVEHSDGQAFVVVALTESWVPAVVQPGAEAQMAWVARRLRDHLRGR
jgi:beta-lactamase class A